MAARALLLLILGAPPMVALIGTAQAATELPAAPAYIQRGDQVEARSRRYRERLERFHEKLAARVEQRARDLLPKLKAAAPAPVRHGYQILPRLVPDAPPPHERPRARSAWYSWPWTEQMIEREMQKIQQVEAELAHIEALTDVERRAGYDKMVAEYARLAENRRTIDAHIQYNRLWQRAVGDNKPGYDRQTALHDAVLERQAILDALSATDEAAFRKALGGIKGIDPAKSRDALDGDLRARERVLAREIREATDPMTPRPFLTIERPAPDRWVIRVPFYTDIDDAGFVQSFKTAVERIWQIRDGDEEFGVEVAITHIPAARLYGARPECGREGRPACVPPGKGDKVDLQAHIALFPENAAVLTTGANSLHVTGRAIVVSPHDVAPHVLAHEFGHILGFRDVYFRGYRDLGADGYGVMEVVADPDDIMGAPGTGPVLRRHFDTLIGDRAPR